MRFNILLSILLSVWIPQTMQSQSFYFGADLSYINEMEECGAVYSVNGEARDPYAIFQDQGCNLVRLRLWHTPSWYDQLNSGNRYSDFADVKRSIQRAKDLGMDVLLDFHLSDNWADPAHQVVPYAWAGIVGDLDVLEDSLYNYIYATLYALAQDSLLPELVQIGNETNKGILQSQEQNDSGWSLHWPKNKRLFNAAIDAVRDIEDITGDTIKVALHVANPNDVDWLLDQFWDNDVRDFDIIGMSYYAAYHNIQIAATGNVIRYVKDLYPGKEVMIFETAYPWTNQAADAANNLINSAVPGYPLSPAGQKQWLIDLTQTVLDNGGSGVVYWEPGWVSTDCSTQWAQGSHWENCTFFDYDTDLIENGGIGWMAHPYDFPSAVPSTLFPHTYFELIQSGAEVWLHQLAPLTSSGPFVIALYGMDGKKVLYKGFAEQGKGSLMGIDIQSLHAGVYVIHIVDDQNHALLTEKLMLAGFGKG